MNKYILTYQRQFIAKTLLFLWIILNLDKIAQMNGAFLDKMTRLACRLFFDCMTIKIEKKTKKEYQNESKRQADGYVSSFFARIAIVASEDALFPGRIRNGGVEVSTLQGKYIPKLKDEATIQSDFQKLLDSDYSITEKALRLFLYMSKNQIFWDGNKRCALISANALMYKYGVGLLSIPEADFITFNEYLSNYYHSDQASQERQLLHFMYDHCIFGIDYQS